MTEFVHEVTIDVIIETNKQTIAGSFSSAESFVAWWNELDEIVDRIELKKDDPTEDRDIEDRDGVSDAHS